MRVRQCAAQYRAHAHVVHPVLLHADAHDRARACSEFEVGVYQIVITLSSPTVRTVARMFMVCSCIHLFLSVANDVLRNGSPSS